MPHWRRTYRRIIHNQLPSFISKTQSPSVFRKGFSTCPSHCSVKLHKSTASSNFLPKPHNPLLCRCVLLRCKADPGLSKYQLNPCHNLVYTSDDSLVQFRTILVCRVAVCYRESRYSEPRTTHRYQRQAGFGLICFNRTLR